MPPPHAEEKKISLNLKQMVIPPAPKPKPVVVPPKPKPVPVTQPIPKPIVEKKIEAKPVVQPIKKKVLDQSKKTFAQISTEENNVTKVEKKPVEKKKIEKKIVKKEVKHPKGISSQAQGKKPAKKVQKKRVVKKTKPKRQTKRSRDPLANMLMGAGTSMVPKQSQRPSSSGSYGDRMINDLYGGEFKTYSPTQKKFIRNNLGTIHRITQRTLIQNGYPETAVRTRQQGTNVVSFYLHPNGDISGLKLKTRIGYQALDQNTLDVIRIAYKDYPLPNKKTKIIFYVRYSMY